MIKCHPNVDDSNFYSTLDEKLKDFHIKGYVSKKVLKLLFNIFSWIYLEDKLLNKAYIITNNKLKELFDSFNLHNFKGDSIYYSAILFYILLSKLVDIRALEKGEIAKVKDTNSNKLLHGKSFSFDSLYDIYKNADADLSDNLLLFDSIFIPNNDKEVRNIKSFGEIVNVNSFSSLVRPDLHYKLATKQLLVKVEKEEYNKTPIVYVLQDATYSMERFQEQLKVLKAFILDRSFSNNYDINWLEVTTYIRSEKLYTKKELDKIDFSFNFYGSKVNTELILTDKRFENKKVIIITDGTDNFNFKFNTVTTDINIITFSENKFIKNKILNYGKYFRLII